MPLGKSDSERGAETVPCEMCAKVFGFKDFRMVYRGTIDKEWQPAAMGIRVPLSQTLFCVVEVSKQGICVPQMPGSRKTVSCGFLLRWLPAP